LRTYNADYFGIVTAETHCTSRSEYFFFGFAVCYKVWHATNNGHIDNYM